MVYFRLKPLWQLYCVMLKFVKTRPISMNYYFINPPCSTARGLYRIWLNCFLETNWLEPLFDLLPTFVHPVGRERKTWARHFVRACSKHWTWGHFRVDSSATLPAAAGGRCDVAGGWSPQPEHTAARTRTANPHQQFVVEPTSACTDTSTFWSWGRLWLASRPQHVAMGWLRESWKV